jgi:hypothetical protein
MRIRRKVMSIDFKQEPLRLGKSQKAVFELLGSIKDGGPMTAQEVGDALYEKTSSCFVNGHYGMGGGATPEQIRLSWASGILNSLKKRGLAEFEIKGCGYVQKRWSLTEKGVLCQVK